MTRAEFNRLGRALGGRHWKSWLARQTGWSRRHIIRISQGDYQAPAGLQKKMQALRTRQAKALKAAIKILERQARP